MDVSDHELLCRTCRGDSAAAESLWRRHAPGLRVFACSITRSADVADDVVQSVFCRIVGMKLRQVRDVRDVRAWLAVVTRRECLNTLRSARREYKRRAQRVGASAGKKVGSRSSEEIGAGGRDGGGASDGEMQRALERLPRRAREVIVLRDVLGLTFDQLAIALSVPRGTASSRHESARRALAMLLESAGHGDPGPSVSSSGSDGRSCRSPILEASSNA